MGKHTPGPWRASFDTDYTWFIEADIGCVGELNMWQPDAADADARLIAAAPDLLEALEEVLVQSEHCFLEHYGRTDEDAPWPLHIAKARAAIAKAKGEG